jgi:hypothetical protein
LLVFNKSSHPTIFEPSEEKEALHLHHVRDYFLPNSTIRAILPHLHQEEEVTP